MYLHSFYFLFFIFYLILGVPQAAVPALPIYCYHLHQLKLLSRFRVVAIGYSLLALTQYINVLLYKIHGNFYQKVIPTGLKNSKIYPLPELVRRVLAKGVQIIKLIIF